FFLIKEEGCCQLMQQPLFSWPWQAKNPNSFIMKQLKKTIGKKMRGCSKKKQEICREVSTECFNYRKMVAE
ncbi:MAG: hypothetical protein ACI4OJ_06495, partial [Lachnospiraceae bacterium]